MPAQPEVSGFFEVRTGSIQYVTADPERGQCAIIDPVLDYDEKSGATGAIKADRLLVFVREKGYAVRWILDTHPHADHFSAAQYLKEKTGAPTAIGEKVVEVQKLWKAIYNWTDFPTDGSQWDKLFTDDESFRIGNIDARVMLSPGHTLASITYVIGDAAFVHDTPFMPDSGTAVPTSPAAIPMRFGLRSRQSSPFPSNRGFSPPTTASPMAANPNGSRRSPNRRATNIPMSNFKAREAFVAGAMPATGCCRCLS